ncbi:MAG: tRNA dihydrouridine synthase DusB [Planctomycetia bacterium]|nr:tRNA dihydrouridine synthase DusB [Planctomycetia bacterium]
MKHSLQIGNLTVEPPILSAPMAGFTNYAYREILRFLGGVGLIATEMVSARSFVHLDAQGEGHPARLWGVQKETRPLAVQIWDNEPDSLAETGRRLVQEYQVSVVDLNFGCPASKIMKKSSSGSYLLRNPQKVGDLVARVVKVCRPTPVTAKIRLGLTADSINAIDVAQAVESAGAAALTVHGRTAQQMYSGFADWNEIARIKPFLKQIPLIGNGDIRTVEDAMDRLTHFAIDGIMIGRGGLESPWLFRQIAQAINGLPVDPEPTLKSQKQLLLKHYSLVRKRFGDEKAVVLMRRYACNYAKHKPGARIFRNKISSAQNEEEFLKTVETFYPTDINDSKSIE